MEPITYASGDLIETQRKAIDQAIKIFGIEEKLSINQVERIVSQLTNRLCKAHGYSSSDDTLVIEMEVVQVATKSLPKNNLYNCYRFLLSQVAQDLLRSPPNLALRSRRLRL